MCFDIIIYLSFVDFNFVSMALLLEEMLPGILSITFSSLINIDDSDY